MNDIQKKILDTIVILLNDNEITHEAYSKIIEAAEIKKVNGGTIWAEEKMNNTRIYIRREKDGHWIEFDWYDGRVITSHDQLPDFPEFKNYNWVKIHDGWKGSRH